MGEIGVEYKVLQRPCEPDTISQEHRPLSTRNLEELDRELAEIERKLLPLLNTIRAMRGEKPIYPPKR